LKQWQERIDTKVGGWSPGEPANMTAPKKGSVEVRIINLGDKMDGACKLPAMSRGFESAVKTLVSALTASMA